MRHDKLTALLTPAVEALGYECVGVEYNAHGAGGLLRVYIDVAERVINVDDCQAVSREVSALLDVEDPVRGNYTLEVSSPGVARPLFSAEHFKRVLDEQVKILMGLPVNGRRRFQGLLKAVEGKDVIVNQDGKDVRLGIDNMHKAQLVPDWAALGKRSKTQV